MSEYGYFCEGRGGYEGGSYGSESPRMEHTTDETTELDVTKEQLDSFKDVMRIWADLIEKGGDMDSNKKSVLRANLANLLSQIGIAVNDDNRVDLESLKGFVLRLEQSQEKPKAKSNYPSKQNFLEVFDGMRDSFVGFYKDVKGRDGFDLGEYLYSLGVLMDSEVAYEHIFADDSMSETDSGRHRKMALLVLERCGYFMNHKWLKA